MPGTDSLRRVHTPCTLSRASLGAEPGVCTLSQIPYENNTPRPLAAGLLITLDIAGYIYYSNEIIRHQIGELLKLFYLSYRMLINNLPGIIIELDPIDI
jgi:hypothetical protein